MFSDCRSPILDVNELLSKYVDKTCMNSALEFKMAEEELMQYLNAKICI